MKVLISGAGIAGPAMAWYMARTGASVTVVERAKALLPYGQNIDVHGGALKLLKRMGLFEELRRYNTTEVGTRLVDHDGKPLASFPIGKEGDGKVSFSSEFEILRGDLSKILYEASLNHKNAARYLFDTTVTRVIDHDSEAKSVKVELSNGQIEEFDVLVASDGQWSRIRKQCFAAEDVTIRDLGMYAVYFTIPKQKDDNRWWEIFLTDKSRIVTLRPDPHGTMRAMVTHMPRTASEKKIWQEAALKGDKEAQKALIKRQFADVGWQTDRFLQDMTNADDFYFHDIKQVKMTSWHNGRVICLGDTAYAPTPLTGAGASLAILGAYVLSGELSKLTPEEHPRVAFERYQSAFKPFVEETQAIPPFFPGVCHPQSIWGVQIARGLLWIFSKLAAMPALVKKFEDEHNDDYELPEYDGLLDHAETVATGKASASDPAAAA
jgi:2-polyprenyl-6-methoxyphenol hydroxylase-like FAD-dependent oxidoreductase